MWKDQGLAEAGREYAALIRAQRLAFSGKKPKPKPDFPEKAMSPAIIAAWAFITGALHDNEERRKRHYALCLVKGKDPLNASELTNGRHKTDGPTYRGLGYRTDAKERGRFAELFFYQAENGHGISAKAIEIAIKQHVVKQAQLDLIKSKED